MRRCAQTCTVWYLASGKRPRCNWCIFAVSSWHAVSLEVCGEETVVFLGSDALLETMIWGGGLRRLRSLVVETLILCFCLLSFCLLSFGVLSLCFWSLSSSCLLSLSSSCPDLDSETGTGGDLTWSYGCAWAHGYALKFVDALVYLVSYLLLLSHPP